MIQMQVDIIGELVTSHKRSDKSRWIQIQSIGEIVSALYDKQTAFVTVRLAGHDICFDPTVTGVDYSCISFIFNEHVNDTYSEEPIEYFFANTPLDVPDMVREAFNFIIASSNSKIAEAHSLIKKITNIL